MKKYIEAQTGLQDQLPALCLVGIPVQGAQDRRWAAAALRADSDGLLGLSAN